MEKEAKGINWECRDEEIRMDDARMKRYPISHIIREMQLKQ